MRQEKKRELVSRNNTEDENEWRERKASSGLFGHEVCPSSVLLENI